MESVILKFLGTVLIGIGVGLQFVSVYKRQIDALNERTLLIKVLQSRFFQLIGGFFLLFYGIKLLQFN
jgi:hypothetical protein|tara:strand:+ start:484 stop:687 length:204 start_codon:yes stop_codon:yes gene_type:complete